MKAGVLKSINEISYMSVADPKLEPGDLLLKVKAATVCGTDIRIFRGRKTAGIRYPSVIGHEFSGEIVDNGGHRQFVKGQAVCVCPQFTCGHCEACLRGAENLCVNMVAMGYEIDGGFAEYVRIPADGVRSGNVFAMPQGLSFDVASLAEPLACVMNGQELAGVKMGDNVIILGSGPIGVLHTKLARHKGVNKIIVSDPNAARRDFALKAGADVVVDPSKDNVVERIKAETGGYGADVAICAIGVPALANDALAMLRTRGRLSLFAGFDKGIKAEIDVNAIHYREITVTGAFGLSRLLFQRALYLVADKRMDFGSLLTHRFHLSDIAKALATAEQGSAIKVAITAS